MWASIAKKLAALPKNGSKPRMVVIMQAADFTIVAVGGDVTEYPIIAPPREKLVDINGACDAYPDLFRKRAWRIVVPLDEAHLLPKGAH